MQVHRRLRRAAPKHCVRRIRGWVGQPLANADLLVPVGGKSDRVGDVRGIEVYRGVRAAAPEQGMIGAGRQPATAHLLRSAGVVRGRMAKAGEVRSEERRGGK